MSGPYADLRRRPRRIVPAVACAIVLLAVAVVTLWAALQQLAVGRWPAFVAALLDALGRTAWASPAGLVVAGLVVILGVLLLVLAFAPGRYRSVLLDAPRGANVRRQSCFLSASGLAKLATAHAGQIDGVERVRATVRGRRVSVRLVSSLDEPAALAGRVRTALDQRLATAGVKPAPRVRVRVTRRGSAG